MATITTTTAAAASTPTERAKSRVRRRLQRVVFPPTSLVRSPRAPFLFQVSLHRIPAHLEQEVKLVFPSIVEGGHQSGGGGSSSSSSSTSSDDGRVMLAIPTLHMCRFDVLERNDTNESERVRVFARFAHFANVFKILLLRKDRAAFVDYVDIDGGASTTTGGQAIYDEVMSCKALLGYKMTRYCGVAMIVHPTAGWKRLTLHTMLVYASPSDALEVLQCMVEQYTISLHAVKGEMLVAVGENAVEEEEKKEKMGPTAEIKAVVAIKVDKD